MKFRIHGADRETAEELAFEVEASTVQEAREKASGMGYLVAQIEPLSVPEKPVPQHSLCCPNCHSENVQKISIIHSMGTTMVSEQGSLKARQSNWWTGAPKTKIKGTISTQGTHQNELAKLVAPPSVPKQEISAEQGIAAFYASGAGLFVWGCVWIWNIVMEGTCSGLFMGFLWGGVASIVPMLIVLAIVPCLLSTKSKSSKQIQAEDDYANRCSKWELTYLCLRCGHRFIPK